jgi:predicted Kef-type K+ transport protein
MSVTMFAMVMEFAMMMFVSSRVVPFLLVSSVGRHRIFFNVALALTCIAAHGESNSYYCMVKCISSCVMLV